MDRDTILRDIITRRDTNSLGIAHGAMYRGDIGILGDILRPGDFGGVGGSQRGSIGFDSWQRSDSPPFF